MSSLVKVQNIANFNMNPRTRTDLYRQLLLHVSDKLEEEEKKKFLFLIGDGLPITRKEGSFLDVLERLNEARIIARSNLGTLKSWLKDGLHREDLVHLVMEYELCILIEGYIAAKRQDKEPGEVIKTLTPLGCLLSKMVGKRQDEFPALSRLITSLNDTKAIDVWVINNVIDSLVQELEINDESNDKKTTWDKVALLITVGIEMASLPRMKSETTSVTKVLWGHIGSWIVENGGMVSWKPSHFFFVTS